MQGKICEGLQKPFQCSIKLLDIKGLCEFFCISEKTAYQLVRQRSFPSIKVGGRYRIIVDELLKWMEKQSKSKK